MDTNANGRPRRRIIVAAPRSVAPATVLAPMACPFVHATAGIKPACTVCKRAFTDSELKEFAAECNGDVRCSLGRHVASCCEGCMASERYGKRIDHV